MALTLYQVTERLRALEAYLPELIVSRRREDFWLAFDAEASRLLDEAMPEHSAYVQERLGLMLAAFELVRPVNGASVTG